MKKRKAGNIVIPVFDAPDFGPRQIAAKILVSSLLRCGFGGNVVILHNTQRMLFLTERQRVSELYLSDMPEGPLSDEDSLEALTRWRKSSRAEERFIISPFCLCTADPTSLVNGSYSYFVLNGEIIQAEPDRHGKGIWNRPRERKSRGGKGHEALQVGIAYADHENVYTCRPGIMVAYDILTLGEAEVLSRMFGDYIATFYGDAAHLLMNVLEF